MKSSTTTSEREQRNREFFDEWARKYDAFRISPWFRYTQELALEQFNWRDDASLLDVGCGTGAAVCAAASRLTHGRASGVDVSPSMVEKARANVPPELEARIEFRVSGAESLPFDAEQFDFVLCTNSFHHYHEPETALLEMKRVLKAGGELVIFENAPDLSLYTWLWDRFLRIFEAGHVCYYKSQVLGNMIRAAQYNPVERRVLRNEFLKRGKLFASIQVWHARNP